MSVNIRQASADDAHHVVAMVRALAEYEREPDKVKMDAPACRRALAAGHVQALLGFEGERVVAMALYFFNFSSWTGKRGLFLEDLFVVPAARGAGLGLTLLKRLAALAVAGGCGRMEWNVLDWNDSAKGFYRMLGARRAEGWEVWRLEGDALTEVGGG